ncbi:hypothetical protein [Aeromicrobium fastidiosum]|uniref:Uncharacterized protein n=1 Tax=Aeromicrobium fastidiosum TaxID=52699 RepID=A0A641ARH4_9ACTN|nr:hypothetical protein [Aeromicrobium fastidiosum]KAA1380716.1 hypothetical protein ESP62_006005 [Aeromicrobium fastidiosum]MBP2390330.1 hypothetical protein [Aeromicrobium fastidiosum]
MVDEQQPAKRVVKRVVKKTVARPSTPEPAPAPVVRYGRPVATATRPSTASAGKPAPAKAKAQPRPTGPATPRQKTTRPKTPRQRPQVDLRAKVTAARATTGRVWWAVADPVSDGSRATARLVAARARAIAAWRLPHLSPYPASLITGAVVGVVAVLLGAGSLSVFESVRGVSSGGGLWGGITFTVVAIVGVLLGESLLRGFGTPAPRLRSFLAAILTIVAMLGLFLDLVDGVAGLVLVPLLSLAGYVLSHWLVDLAENAPTDD